MSYEFRVENESMRNVFFIVFAFFIFKSNAQVDSLRENEVWSLKENAVLMDNPTIEKGLMLDEQTAELKKETYILYKKKLYGFEEGKAFLHQSDSFKILTDKDSIADILDKKIERLIIINDCHAELDSASIMIEE